MKILLLLLASLAAYSQTNQPVPLRVYTRNGINADLIIDNRSTIDRSLRFVTIACSGSGTWQASLLYGSTTSSFTTYGSSATVANTDAMPTASGFLFTSPNYIKVDLTGSVTCNFSGFQDLYSTGGSGGSVPYPIPVASGGTGATTAADARTNLGIPWTISGLNAYYNTGNISIGTTSAAANLTVSGQPTVIAPPAGTTLHLSGANAANSLLINDAFGSIPGFITRHAAGTAASPTATQNNTTIFIQGGRGYGATGFSATTRASIFGFAAENWTDSAQGTYLALRTTTSGTTTESNKWLIDNAGHLLAATDNAWDIGNTSTLRPRDVNVARNLTVAGSASFGTPLPITSGGTGGATGVAARTNLGLPNITSTNYVWSATNGGTVSGTLTSAGSNTLTFTPCPLGIAGATVGHNIRIYDGVGTAEVVAITGGTCTSGAASGTITVTTVNTHGGAWVTATATAGIKEAHAANPSEAAIFVPSGTHTLYGATNFVSQMSLVGSGDKATFLIFSSPTMDGFVGTTWLNATGLNVTSASPWQTAGTVFKLSNVGTVQLQNIFTTQMYDVAAADVLSVSDSWFAGMVRYALYKPPSAVVNGVMRVSNIYADGRYYNGGAGQIDSVVTVAGSVLTRTSGGVFTLLRAGGLVKVAGVIYTIQSVDSANQITLTSAPTPGVGVTFEAHTELLSPSLVRVDGILAGGTFTNLWFQAAQICMTFASLTGSPTNEIVVTNAIFDGSGIDIAAVSMVNDNLVSADSSNSLKFSDIRANTSGYGFLAQYISYFSLSDSTVNSIGTNGPKQVIACVNCNHIIIADNTFNQSGATAAAISIDSAGASDDIAIQGNTIVEAPGGTLGAAFAFANSGVTNVVVSENKVYGSPSFVASTSLSSSNVVMRNNYNSAQARLQIAVTGSNVLTLPITDESILLEIVGGGTSGTVSTINGGYNGKQVKFYMSTGITFNTAGNIINGLVASTGQLILATFDSSISKWILK